MAHRESEQHVKSYNHCIPRFMWHDKRWGIKSFSIVLDRLWQVARGFYYFDKNKRCTQRQRQRQTERETEAIEHETQFMHMYEQWTYVPVYDLSFLLIFIAAFMCHHNTFLVYHSMRNATLERWERVTHISIGFAWIVAALFGIAGYATFRALSQGDLQTNCHFWSNIF